MTCVECGCEVESAGSPLCDECLGAFNDSESAEVGGWGE